MAIESAQQLAEFLKDVPPEGVTSALQDYERSQRPRVESAQDNSRMLARLMFHQGHALALVRDVAARFLTLKMALGPINRLLETAPGRQQGATS